MGVAVLLICLYSFGQFASDTEALWDGEGHSKLTRNLALIRLATAMAILHEL